MAIWKGGCRATCCVPPFIDPLAIENPWAVQIMDVMLGEDFWAKLPYHCNSTEPNWPDTQVVHRDQLHLFPGFAHCHAAAYDGREHSVGGLYRGKRQHRGVAGHASDYGSRGGTIDPADVGRAGGLEERALTMPSMRTNMPAGSTVVRDMRVWHRATPNRTNCRRTMMSLVYHRYFPSLGVPIQGGRSAASGDYGPAIGAGAADFSLQ